MKALTRALPRTAAVFPVRLNPRSARQPTQPQLFFRSSCRRYSSGLAPPSVSKTGLYIGGATVAALSVGGYFCCDNVFDVHLKKGSAGKSVGIFKPTSEDYQKLY